MDALSSNHTAVGGIAMIRMLILLLSFFIIHSCDINIHYSSTFIPVVGETFVETPTYVVVTVVGEFKFRYYL